MQIPLNLLRAAAAGAPGVRFHFALIDHTLRGLAGSLSLAQAHKLGAQVMDSVRYFEFDFLRLAVKKPASMGDVSYRIFGRIGELPGLGVIGLEFMKP